MPIRRFFLYDNWYEINACLLILFANFDVPLTRIIVNFIKVFFIIGMVSLYTTVAISVVRLMIMKFNDISELNVNRISLQSTRKLIMIWCLGLSLAVPPLLGFGQYGQNMVVVR